VSRAKPRPVGSCLPLLSEIATQNMPIIIPAPARACCAAASATKPDALPDLSTDASGTPFRPRPDHPCCFPIGEPKTLAFRYCDAPASAGRPYCAEHAAVAYVRGRDKRPWSLFGAASHG
jgi:GcrA cell cycle regulator